MLIESCVLLSRQGLESLACCAVFGWVGRSCDPVCVLCSVLGLSRIGREPC
jgi:hypothetical protein